MAFANNPQITLLLLLRPFASAFVGRFAVANAPAPFMKTKLKTFLNACKVLKILLLQKNYFFLQDFDGCVRFLTKRIFTFIFSVLRNIDFKGFFRSCFFNDCFVICSNIQNNMKFNQKAYTIVIFLQFYFLFLKRAVFYSRLHKNILFVNDYEDT